MKFCLTGLLFVSLVACAQQPAYTTAARDRMAQTSDAPRTAQELEEDFAAKLGRFSKGDSNAQLAFKLMLAEIALQRGRPNVAASTYLELAKTTRDLRIVQRAAEVTLIARQPQMAIEVTSLWLELEPDSAQARQIMASLLVSTGNLVEARTNLQKMLVNDGAARSQTFLHLNTLLGRYPDKPAVLKLVQELAQPYDKSPEARYAVAIAALNAKDTELALKEVRQAAQLKPGWEPAASVEAQALYSTSPDQASDFYKDFLNKNPKAKATRLGYARMLADLRKAPAAKEQFEQLAKESPADSDTLTVVGVLSNQLKDYESAERYLKQALQSSPKEPDVVRMSIGQVYEDSKRFGEAEKWYRAVEPSEQYLGAQIKVATMLARQDRLQEGRDYLKQIDAGNGQQRVQLILAEAQLLRDAKSYQPAYDALSAGLDQFPGAPDLLYDRAMIAEKMDRLDLVEQDLKLLISLQPDHAHAYNALGYTLADRTNRYDEALGFIEKAVKLSPDDAFIIDSLGWVQYRMGRLDESVGSLRLAYSKRPDPEIAAHLGEALWAQGKKDEAKGIWQNSLKDHPDNEALSTTIKKYAQ